ncbi:MAG: hypothetical protein ACD_21C00181G0002 [uncultured bacterium]|nr:MAG: hypothetical protein ACD_21C00181G0002 [uncultured bacterium]
MHHIDKDHIQAQLRSRGIDPDHIRSLHIKLQSGELDQSSFVVAPERLRPPTTKDMLWPDQFSQATLQAQGENLLQQDKLLIFWLSGGAATRYFDRSKIRPDEIDRYGKILNSMGDTMSYLPKGTTPVVNGMSYLELKVRNLLLVTKQCHLDAHPPVIIMTSFITDEQTRAHLSVLYKKYPDLEPSRFHFVVQQPRLPRFTKVADLKNIDLFIDARNQLSFAPCGHGDFVYLVQDYLRQTHIPKVEYMFFANADNLAATIEPWLLGLHAQTKTGRLVELVEKQNDDQGGAPCFVDNELVILEGMKFPANFDQAQIPWINTNTFWFTIADLLRFQEDLPLVLAEKTIPNGDVIQLEHFACDVNVPSQYVVLPRLQRFWPVKRYVDLLIYQDPGSGTTQHEEFEELLRTAYNVQ